MQFAGCIQEGLGFQGQGKAAGNPARLAVGNIPVRVRELRSTGIALGHDVFHHVVERCLVYAVRLLDVQFLHRHGDVAVPFGKLKEKE